MPEPLPRPTIQDIPATRTPPAPAGAIPQPDRSRRIGSSHGSAAKKKGPNKALVAAALLGVPLLLGAGLAGAWFISRELENSSSAENRATPHSSHSSGEVAENNYIRIGWKAEASELLTQFLAGRSAREKMPYVMNAVELAGTIEEFYGGGLINDSDTPADGFSTYDLSEEDRRRGLFMMIYDQPPQFDMKEFFRPLASLEVQHGVDEADLLLSTVARVDNFAMDPVRIHAFFKRTPEGLKLDWEIYAQTKYRTFQNFVELPAPGQSGIFRVFILEDVPEKGRTVPGTRSYRLADPANTGDTARVNVRLDSDIGRELSIINWRGTRETRPITRTATLKLTWTDDPQAPELQISEFICWEFLGLGGQKAPATVSNQ
jgi:hypothetical protein